MNRRTFAGLMAGAAVCSTGKFTTEARAESKPLDVARMLAAAYQQNKQNFLPIAVSPNMAGSLQTNIGDYAVFIAKVLTTMTKSDDFKARVDVNRDIAWARLWCSLQTAIRAPHCIRGYSGN